MTAERPGRRELAELVPDHVLGDEDRDELSAVVNGEGVPNEIGRHSGTARPSANHLLVAGLVRGLDLVLEVLVDERTFFD